MAVLTDKDFLDEYVSFALWQPAVFSAWLLNQMNESGGFNQSAAIQIFINFQLSMEALTMWYFALQEWKPNETSLLSVFSGINLSESKSSKYSAARALQEIAATPDPERLLERLNQPWPFQLLVRGWSHENVRVRRETADRMVERLKAILESRGGSDGDILRAYNKVKHGLLALRDPKNRNDQTLYPIARVLKDLGNSADVTPVGLRTNRSDLRPLVRSTLEICQMTAALLSSLSWFHFTTLSWRDYRGSNDDMTAAANKLRGKVLELLEEDEEVYASASELGDA